MGLRTRQLLAPHLGAGVSHCSLSQGHCELTRLDRLQLLSILGFDEVPLGPGWGQLAAPWGAVRPHLLQTVPPTHTLHQAPPHSSAHCSPCAHATSTYPTCLGPCPGRCRCESGTQPSSWAESSCGHCLSGEGEPQGQPGPPPLAGLAAAGQRPGSSSAQGRRDWRGSRGCGLW